MPRRDGFPTNREMQVDFTAQAREVFIAAAERQIESKVSPGLQDKPLDHITLCVSQLHEIRDEHPQSIAREQLILAPFSNRDAAALSENELFASAGPEVLSHYANVAALIGSVTLTDSLRFRPTLGSIGIQGNYYGHKTDGRVRHAGTFRERASKQSLAAAKYFADEALQYTQSPHFDDSTMSRLASFMLGYSDEDPRFGMTHYFRLEISADLPLNGREPRAFLEEYRNVMAARLVRRMETFERLKDLHAPEVILEGNAVHLKATQDALEKVEKYL